MSRLAVAGLDHMAGSLLGRRVVRVCVLFLFGGNGTLAGEEREGLLVFHRGCPKRDYLKPRKEKDGRENLVEQLWGA